MKAAKKILSFALALILVLSLSVPAMADTEDGLIYTALGDSASNGYGMAEYGTRTYIYGQVVDASYPALFASAIGATTFYQDCLSGLRSEDLRYLLDPTHYAGDEYTHGTALEMGGFVMNSLQLDGIYSVEQLSDLYIQHVTEADVITLDIGLNNFGNFLVTQIRKFLDNGKAYNVSLTPEMDAWLKTTEAAQLHDALLDLFENLEITEGMTLTTIIQLVENVMHWFAYSYIDNLICFDAIVNRIYELNPDVDLYVLGLYNCFPELYITNDMVNIGAIVTMMMKSVNTHYACFAPHCCDYVYVDVLDTEVFGMPKNLTDPEFMTKFTENMGAAVHPNYNGHYSMFEKLYAKYQVPLKDVKSSSDIYEAVSFALGCGAMESATEHYFMPLLCPTRSDIAKALYVINGSPDFSGTTEPFIDVNSKTENYDAILWAYNTGVIKGITSLTFSPLLNMNRSDFATVLWKCAGSPAPESTVKYKDSGIVKSSSRDAVAWCIENGVMFCNNLGYFNPGALLTRGDLADAIYCYFNNI